MLAMGVIVLIRHGQTEWSASGQHTSYTDIDLTPHGEQQALGLAALLAGRTFAAVWCSPRLRARRTAALAGLAPSAERVAVDEDLAEWAYGTYEGLTTAQIRAERPDWSLWTDGCPGGEMPDEVGARLDRVLARARAKLPEGDVALIGHGHASRVAAVRWVDLPVGLGGRFYLDTASVSELGIEHGAPVVTRWNLTVGGLTAAPAP
jgi:broad specificity phosphatase PhoE